MIELDREISAKLGPVLGRRFDQYKNDRKLSELKWMQNLRQFRGKYDPEVENLIPKERSKVYPRDSRVKLTGFVAKMMEMMFPVSDTNWELVPTTIPSISKSELDLLVLQINNEHMRIAQETGEIKPVTSEEIEMKVRDYADKRAKAMSDQCRDQLDELDYPEVCKRALRSGGIYGCGIVKGPMVRFQKERYWQPDGLTYVPVERVTPRPVYDTRKIWDIYPDMGAKSWFHQEGLFERIVMTRPELYAMAMRPEFFGDVIKNYLRDHQSGNYKPLDFETDMRVMNNTAQTTALDSGKYEVIVYYGFVSAHEVAAMGKEIPQESLCDSYLVEVWMLENEVIKFDGNPFGEAPHSKYHAFFYGEDEDSAVTGVSLMDDMRDSQLSICAATRMLMDNAASSAGPILEINRDLLARGADVGPIHAFKSIYREGVGPDAQAPAVRDIQVASHVPELMNVIAAFRQNLDTESTLPSWTMGQPEKLGEAFRTSNNMSMMTGGANTITKDIARSFDKFTSSVIQSLVDWNMEFNEREDIKGDFQVQAKGSRSLIAKEVRGQAIEQFMMTLQPQERALLRTIPTLIERMKARDLPYDRLLVTETEAEEILESMSQQEAAQGQKADMELQAKIRNLIARANKDDAMAQEIMALLMPKAKQMKIDTDTKQAESGLKQTSDLLGLVNQETGEEETDLV
jgi:hypothetical protein